MRVATKLGSLPGTILLLLCGAVIQLPACVSAPSVATCPGTSCGGPEDCAELPGTICFEGCCLNQCGSSRDCDPAAACSDGVCVPVTDPECTADDQCNAPPACKAVRIHGCVGGACQYDNIADGTLCPYSGNASVFDGVCQDGACKQLLADVCNAGCAPDTCIAGVCQTHSARGDACDTAPIPDNDDCEAELICNEGFCLTANGGICSANQQCAGSCVGGHCQSVSGVNGTCDDSDDCESGLVCGGGQCSVGIACGGNESCSAAGESCIGGVCRPLAGLGGSCDSGPDSDDCQTALVCSDGTCLRDPGAVCGGDNECTTSVCQDRCRLTEGSSCGASDQCANGLACTGSPTVCTPCSLPGTPSESPTVADDPPCGSTSLLPLGAGLYWQGTNPTGTDLTHPASASYPVSASGTYYVRAHNSCGWSTLSLGTTVTLYSDTPPTITSEPADVTICNTATDDIQFHVAATGSGVTYHWYMQPPAPTVDTLTQPACYSGGATDTLTVENSCKQSPPCSYFVTVGEICGNTVDSRHATITVRTASTDITGLTPSRIPACSGATLTLTATGGTLGTDASYQWFRNDTCTGTPFATGTTNTQTDSPTTTTNYSVRRAGGFCNVTTACESVAVTVVASPTKYGFSGWGSYCEDNPTNVTLTLSDSDSGVHYQLMKNGVADTGTNNNPPGTGGALTWTRSAAGNYTVVATGDSSGCPSTMTGTAIITEIAEGASCGGAPYFSTCQYGDCLPRCGTCCIPTDCGGSSPVCCHYASPSNRSCDPMTDTSGCYCASSSCN